MRNGALAWVVLVATGGCGYSTGDFSQVGADAGHDTEATGDTANSDTAAGDTGPVTDSVVSGDSKASDSAGDTGVDTTPPPTCTGGTTDCSGVCVDLQKDSNNCGGCGNRCDPSQSCRGGSCR